MAQIKIPRNYLGESTPTEQQLDAIRLAVESFFNFTKVASGNIVPGAIASVKMAQGAVGSSRILSSSVTSTTLSDLSITTAGIAASAASGPVIANGVGLTKTYPRVIHTGSLSFSGTIAISGVSPVLYSSPTLALPQTPLMVVLSAGIGVSSSSPPNNTVIIIQLINTVSGVVREAVNEPVNSQLKLSTRFSPIVFMITPPAGGSAYQLRLRNVSSLASWSGSMLNYRVTLIQP